MPTAISMALPGGMRSRTTTIPMTMSDLAMEPVELTRQLGKRATEAKSAIARRACSSPYGSAIHM